MTGQKAGHRRTTIATTVYSDEAMSEPLPEIYLARHGETAWTISHQHTGRSDIPLTERGERNARSLGQRLRGMTFAKVFTSPMVRSRRTAELAGFGDVAHPELDLMEWDYGHYDGKTTAEILEEKPDWLLFRDGCSRGRVGRGDRVPGGQSRRAAPSCRWSFSPLRSRPLLSGAGCCAGSDYRVATAVCFI